MISRRMMMLGTAAAAAGGYLPRSHATEAAPFAHSTPSHVSMVGLRTRNLEDLRRWYGHVLGLETVHGSRGRSTFGRDGKAVLDVEQAGSVRLAAREEAGLYHTAFLLPSRRDLARWVRHAIESRIPVDGASDHAVSEAFYLTDPEGNGIEIYADRDPSSWAWEGNSVVMGSKPVDLDGILGELRPGDASWLERPATAVIGHVHLKVGDVGEAEAFWNGTPSMATVRKREGAVFLSSGGYHHHVAANVWHTPGAGPRPTETTGLAFVEVARDAGAGESVFDPWGNEVRFVGKA